MVGFTFAIYHYCTAQAINHPLGKNLLGCYYPAETVVIDPAVCQRLSARHVRNGLAEALKHGLCQSEDLVSRIVDPVRERGEEVLHDAGYIEDICKASIEIKVWWVVFSGCSLV
jgi:3-dehydroquinate synthase